MQVVLVFKCSFLNTTGSTRKIISIFDFANMKIRVQSDSP